MQKQCLHEIMVIFVFMRKEERLDGGKKKSNLWPQRALWSRHAIDTICTLNEKTFDIDFVTKYRVKYSYLISIYQCTF